MKTKKWAKRNKSFFAISVWTVVLIWCILFFVLLGWGILSSVKDLGFYWMDRVGIPTRAQDWAFDNYTIAFKSMKIKTSDGWVFFPEMLFNSLVYITLYGVLNVVSPMLCSYVYAKYGKRVKWVKLLWGIVLVNLYVPLSSSLAASLNFAMQLGIYDNLFLFSTSALNGFGGNFLIYYAIWKGVSWEFAEAAFIDGASDFKVLIKIMFPMTITVFGVLFLTQVIALWANYATPMLFLPSYPTLAYGVFAFQQTNESGASMVPIKLAALIAVALPIFTLFMIFKEKMMGSLTMGGLKG